MVKRVKITYIGGIEKIIQYRAILKENDKEIIFLDTVGTRVTVIKANVCQIRELS